jgi:hypothetical protein
MDELDGGQSTIDYAVSIERHGGGVGSGEGCS